MTSFNPVPPAPLEAAGRPGAVRQDGATCTLARIKTEGRRPKTWAPLFDCRAMIHRGSRVLRNFSRRSSSEPHTSAAIRRPSSAIEDSPSPTGTAAFFLMAWILS
jgi:hypothetical protein